MDEGARCERCPLQGEDPVDSGRGLLCAGLIEYPIWLVEASVEVEVSGPEELPAAMSEFMTRIWKEVMMKPGATLSPRAFMRFRTTKTGVPRTMCPHSFPVDIWAKLALEQVLMDTGGMQVRFLRNDRPWLEQPAIYTDVVAVVQESRGVASEWLEDKRKKESPK